VEEALATGLRVVGAVAAPGLARTARGTELRAALESHAVPVQDVSAALFTQLADTETPQGIVAVVQPRRWKPEEVPLGASATLLVIDGVQDPGNVGTLVRTAHALGARASIVLRGTTDVWGAKALRAAMGATFRHPIVAFDDDGFVAWARRLAVTLWATAADGEPLPRALAHRDGGGGIVAIVVGNEGAGIRPHLTAVATRRVAIPLAQGAESLNVAVAAGILLYEVTRGR
jgi:TrmH family RNA methyltransferase